MSQIHAPDRGLDPVAWTENSIRSQYPGIQIETAATAAARQLVKVESGEGLTTIWHTYGIIQRYMPSVVPAMRAARQQHGEVSFRALSKPRQAELRLGLRRAIRAVRLHVRGCVGLVLTLSMLGPNCSSSADAIVGAPHFSESDSQ
jgi:hypothetical protein